MKIPLRGRTGVVAYATVDEQDAHLAEYRWCRNEGYAMRAVGPRSNSVKVYMHRLIMSAIDGTPPLFHVDHIDGDRLNNRRANLRLVTQAQQNQNVAARPESTSRHRGVSRVAATGKWRAQARLNGQTHHLGYFANEEEAAVAARDWRLEHMTHTNEARA